MFCTHSDTHTSLSFMIHTPLSRKQNPIRGGGRNLGSDPKFFKVVSKRPINIEWLADSYNSSFSSVIVQQYWCSPRLQNSFYSRKSLNHSVDPWCAKRRSSHEPLSSRGRHASLGAHASPTPFWPSLETSDTLRSKTAFAEKYHCFTGLVLSQRQDGILLGCRNTSKGTLNWIRRREPL